ncbi:MAG: tRNA (adenosine(37)-N6)-dimethylallyltransferase MiaA [Rhodospirillales bacterium]|nr:tRNA (adenosine(37)-N6)-dimethylallyltransferase MiaA [Rhodospirillales bacterium]
MAAQPIIIVAGPTASGKSHAALDVAEEFGGAVINADSMQVYRELDVLSARPRFPQTARVPHLLYGCLPVAQPCSAGLWLELATEAISEVRAMGRIPVFVGGTGLYLKALTEGLAPVPDVAQEIRTRARALHRELGGQRFRDRLAALDPEAASHLPAGDTQRLIRAFEVKEATGRTLNEWQAQHPAEPPVDGSFVTVALIPPREALYATVNARFLRMMDEGALDEVRGLVALGLDLKLPAMKAVGVRELVRHLTGEIGLEQAVDAAQRATRQYAKRQFTWLRHQIEGSFVASAQYSESQKRKIFSFIRQFLLTAQS